MKNHFPTLKLNKDCVYLDNAGTSLKTSKVIESVVNYYKLFPLNSHSLSHSKFHLNIKNILDETRELISKWINCNSEEISFTPSATYSFNILALSFSKFINKNDIILLTKLEHSSNIYPWEDLCKKKKSKIDFFYLNNNFSINKEEITRKITKKVKVVSFSHISNNLGVINDVKEIVSTIRKINPKCFILIDACQSISHEKIDVKNWDIDALVFSSHKLYGPTGIGVLWVRNDWEKKIPHLLWGGGKNSSPSLDNETNLFFLDKKFEVGTIPLAQVFGLRESFLFLNEIDWNKYNKNKKKLMSYAIKSLSKIKEIIFYNEGLSNNILLFNLSNFHSQDVSDHLAKNNIFVRSGNFCSPLLKDVIGINSSIRISLAIYNNKKDIDFLIKCIEKIKLDELEF